jgi:hypothetical protein
MLRRAYNMTTNFQRLDLRVRKSYSFTMATFKTTYAHLFSRSIFSFSEERYWRSLL